MNERQRDLFLWTWSRRRAPGPRRVALRGAVIGAIGGLAFSVIMLTSMGAPASSGYTGLSAIIPLLERAGLMLGLAVPAFAAIGWVGANRIYAANEHMFQSLLQAGAHVPEHKPTMQRLDHWPAVMVGIAVAIIAGFILYLFWASSTGRL